MPRGPEGPPPAARLPHRRAPAVGGHSAGNAVAEKLPRRADAEGHGGGGPLAQPATCPAARTHARPPPSQIVDGDVLYMVFRKEGSDEWESIELEPSEGAAPKVEGA